MKKRDKLNIPKIMLSMLSPTLELISSIFTLISTVGEKSIFKYFTFYNIFNNRFSSNNIIINVFIEKKYLKIIDPFDQHINVNDIAAPLKLRNLFSDEIENDVECASSTWCQVDQFDPLAICPLPNDF